MRFSTIQDWRIVFGFVTFVLLSVTHPGLSHQNDFAGVVHGEKHEHIEGSEDPNLVTLVTKSDIPSNASVHGTGDNKTVADVDLHKKLKEAAKNAGLTEEQTDRVARSIGLLDSPPSPNINLFSSKRFCGFSPRVDPSKLSNAAPGQYPWSAAILSNDKKFLCSGTLVSESIVLTTASCITRYRSNSNQPLLVILGAWSLPEGYEYMPELELFVTTAALHPGYNQNVKTPGNAQNNIALLRLAENVDFDMNPHIFPICLIDSSLEQQAGINHCQVLGWPELPEMETWRTRAYLSSGDVKVVKQGCAYHSDKSDNGPCAQGYACYGNEGSTVQCLTNSNRYFQWGIIANEPNCPKDTTVSVPIINLIDHYDFISEYLWTPNPNPQPSRNTLSPIVINRNNLNNGQSNVIRVPAGGAAIVQGIDNPNVVRG